MILYGILASTPTRIPTEDGRPLVSFRVAASSGRHARPVRCRMRGSAARIAGSVLVKGETVALSGRLRRFVFYATCVYISTKPRIKCRLLRVAS